MDVNHWEGWEGFLRLFEWGNKKDMRESEKRPFIAFNYYESNDLHSFKVVLKRRGVRGRDKRSEEVNQRTYMHSP